MSRTGAASPRPPAGEGASTPAGTETGYGPRRSAAERGAAAAKRCGPACRIAVLTLLTALLPTIPAPAQRGGCGMGLGLAGLKAAEPSLGQPPASLPEGRDQAAATAAGLREAAGRLAGCGCRRLAEQAEEAAGIAEQGASESSAAALRRTLERARFSLGLARERAGREGCS